MSNCPQQVAEKGIRAVVNSTTLALAFLAHVVHQNPGAKTRVQAAKRAINLVRAFAHKPPLDNDIAVKYLARGASNAVVRTTRQSPALLAVFVAAIVTQWGDSAVWWERQVALIVLLMFCTLVRGAGITACLRDGVSWVSKDGTQPAEQANFSPQQCCSRNACSNTDCVRGFLLLFPFKKNHRTRPCWVPVAEKAALRLMAKHLKWLKTLPPGTYLFPARRRVRPRTPVGPISFVPNTDKNSRMSPDTLRTLLRRALMECCGLSWEQAKEFGTHSPRIGAMEELRKCGVPAELRQQLGDWMSQQVALSYLQLNPTAQFDVLQHLRRR